MSKTVNELAVELVAAALASSQLKTDGNGPTYQAGEIASAFKIIREAIASDIPPAP